MLTMQIFVLFQIPLLFGAQVTHLQIVFFSRVSDSCIFTVFLASPVFAASTRMIRSDCHQGGVTPHFLHPFFPAAAAIVARALARTVFGPDVNQLLSDVLNTYAHRSIAREGVSGVELLRHWPSILGRPCFT